MNETLLVLAGKTASRLLLSSDYPNASTCLDKKTHNTPYTVNDLWKVAWLGSNELMATKIEDH